MPDVAAALKRSLSLPPLLFSDMRKLAAMVEEAEEEVFQYTHMQPFYFKNDPGGIMYQRHSPAHDSLLDNWHPWEKV